MTEAQLLTVRRVLAYYDQSVPPTVEAPEAPEALAVRSARAPAAAPDEPPIEPAVVIDVDQAEPEPDDEDDDEPPDDDDDEVPTSA